MPKTYWIAHVHVTDPEAYKLYVDGARPAFEKHGANYGHLRFERVGRNLVGSSYGRGISQRNLTRL